uniref:Nucleolar protein 12 n=1 Tax=Macrostomum lignano TaxID=282301 RepID=A0A1I8FUY9_9PLAT
MSSAEVPQPPEDSYSAGQLSKLLQFGSSDQTDSTLPLPARSAPSASKKSTESLKQKSVSKQKQATAKQQKPSASSSAADAESAAASSDRAAAKARSKLAKQREKARQEDPRNERTVFVGNVASAAKKRDLLLLFRAHGPIESVRFRSAAPADAKVVKRLAVIHKKLSRPSLNAYVVFKEPQAAVSAASALNGHCLAGLHLRVDLLDGQAERDDKKCVFLGNLHFKCDEEAVRSAFAQCGHVTNVRLVRDSRTGIGRGFGFVQFADASSVELALKLDGAEVAGRQVRVSRCSSESAQKRRTAASSKQRKQQQPEKQRKQPAGSNNASKKPTNVQRARPTNRTFADAFQRMLDKRRSKQAGKKPAMAAGKIKKK